MNLLATACFLSLIVYIEGHGRLAYPPGRASYWRTNEEAYPYTEEYEWCSDPEDPRPVKCGICGPIYNNNPAKVYNIIDTGELTPLVSFERSNPTYRNVQNSIQKTYKIGQKIRVKLDIEIKHWGGPVVFKVASADGLSTDPSQTVFNKNQLKFTNGSTTMDLRQALITGKGGKKRYEYDVVLPKTLTCKHCVLQWYWLARETNQAYIGCSDIRILA